MGRKSKLSKEQLEYIVDHYDSLSQTEIARELGVDRTIVSYAEKKLGLPPRKASYPLDLQRKSVDVQRSLEEFSAVTKAIRAGKKIKGNFCPCPTCHWLGGDGAKRTCFWRHCIAKIVNKKAPEQPEL